MLAVYNKYGHEYPTILHTKHAEFYMDKVSIQLFSTATFYIVDSDLSRNLAINVKINSDSGLYKFFTESGGEVVSSDQSEAVISSQTIGSYKVYQVNLLWSAEQYVLDSAVIDFVIENTSVIVSDFSIDLYSESVEPESRYATLLSNFKMSVDDVFAKTFKETNINEGLTNHELLNRKKLELLQQMHNLDEYIGSYRGLLDSLRFFGYEDDLIIHEYWRWYNKELAKYEYRTHDISNKYTKEELQELLTYERTNIFDLTFNINDYSDTTIEPDSPVTQIINVVSSAYEAQIKLLNIKQILEQYFLPANVYIEQVILTQYNRIGLREFNYIHNGLIQHTDTNLTDHVYEWFIDADIKNRTYFSYQTLTSASNLQANNIDQIVARTDESVYDADKKILNVDLDQYDLTLQPTFDMLSEKLVRHSTALILYKIMDKYNDLKLKVQRFQCTVIDSESNIIYQVQHYNPIVDPTDVLPQYIQISIDKSGTYVVSVSYIDWTGIEHFYNETIEVKMYELSINLFTQRPVNRQYFLNQEYSTFKKMNDALYKVPLSPPAVKIQDIDLYHTNKTLGEGNPNFDTTILATYDFNQYPNIVGGQVMYNTKQVSKLGFDIPKISELKDMRIDRTRNLIRAFNGCYLFWYFDIVGDGSAKSFNFELGYKNNTDTLEAYALTYTGHVSDEDDYYQLSMISSALNLLPDSTIYGKFCWSVRFMKFAELDGLGQTVYQDRFVLTALSTELDSPIVYDTGDDTKLNISYRAYRQTTYTNLRPYVICRIATATPTPTTLSITLNGTDTNIVNSTATTLAQLQSEIEAEFPDEFDFYVTEEISSVTTELLIVSKNSKSVEITHNLVGTLLDVSREASIADFVKVNQGFDATIYEPVAISVDDSISYHPYDIKWFLYDSDGNEVLNTDQAVCKFWTKLKKHQDNDDYKLVAVWKDKYGTEYTDTFNSVVLIWRKLVDSKYETFNGLTDILFTQNSDKNMWDYDLADIETKPKWYLPFNQQYADIQVIIGGGNTPQPPTPGSNWILATGSWNDAGIWLDLAVWNDV